MKDLAGKTAFVTGAASGIGLGIATALAQAGVKVMLCDIEEAALAMAVADLKLTNADVDGASARCASLAQRVMRDRRIGPTGVGSAFSPSIVCLMEAEMAAHCVGGVSVRRSNG
jgi:NAD(P)-dependent dehydrogenase (short-subunit alcohol dehydrogenase family)